MNKYYKGSSVKMRFQFMDASMQPVDPASVTLYWKLGVNGTETTYVYGTDSQAVREDVGAYYFVLNASSVGVYYARAYGVGGNQAASERLIESISDFP